MTRAIASSRRGSPGRNTSTAASRPASSSRSHGLALALPFDPVPRAPVPDLAHGEHVRGDDVEAVDRSPEVVGGVARSCASTRQAASRPGNRLCVGWYSMTTSGARPAAHASQSARRSASRCPAATSATAPSSPQALACRRLVLGGEDVRPPDPAVGVALHEVQHVRELRRAPPPLSWSANSASRSPCTASASDRQRSMPTSASPLTRRRRPVDPAHLAEAERPVVDDERVLGPQRSAAPPSPSPRRPR